MPVQSDNQPTIVKYVGANYGGIQLLALSRYAIGYVVRGTKHIYYGDACHTVSKGEIFYMGVGNHYVEDIPEEGRPFEQVIVYYSPELLQRTLLYLNMNYSINISNSHSCDRCRRLNHVSTEASTTLRSFFTHAVSYLQDDNFMHDEAAENIKLTELMYLIVSQSDGCLKSKILSNMDASRDNFEQIIYSHIFCDISIEELSTLCNRSLTSFKKEFKRHFYMPPHRWFIRQRLMQSRLLLISTSKSISEIGIECTFPNTSHFIKLFKKEYGTTPAIYRHRHCGSNSAETDARLASVANDTQSREEMFEEVESMAL
ncbi:AraC family transcriptional regulator [Alistipes sp. Z76]|nr:AraC family transcriptional regulator [Alistipes sp. Z76]NCE68559.1 AraC family transcriptional regulator [Muribaculaceae bacterium M3]